MGAFVIWGVSPLWFALLNDLPALEVVAHRIVWAVPAIGLYAAMTGRWPRVRQVGREPRRLGPVALAAAFISVNWFVFILAIQAGRAFEASFGYYIYPIIAVLLGALVFRERIGPLQWAAAGLAALGCLWIALERGTAPWIALVVACSFAAYGIIRKSVPVGPLVGVLWELVLVTPPLLLYLWWIGGGAFGASLPVSLLLLGCSLFTALPLVMYVEAAKRLKFSTVGILFYLNPSLQFASAFLLGETLGPAALGAFGFIWAGVALYCYDLLRHR